MNTKPLLFILFLIVFYACQYNEKKPQSPILSKLEQDSIARNKRATLLANRIESLEHRDTLSQEFMLDLLSIVYHDAKPISDADLRTDYPKSSLIYFIPVKYLYKATLLETPSTWERDGNESFRLVPEKTTRTVAVYQNENRKGLSITPFNTDRDADLEFYIDEIDDKNGKIVDRKGDVWVVFKTGVLRRKEQDSSSQILLFTERDGSDYDDDWSVGSYYVYYYDGDTLTQLAIESYYSVFNPWEMRKEARSSETKELSHLCHDADFTIIVPHIDTLIFNYHFQIGAAFGDSDNDNPATLLFYDIDLVSTNDPHVIKDRLCASWIPDHFIEILTDTFQQVHVWDNNKKQYKIHSTHSLCPYFSDKEAAKMIKNETWELLDYPYLVDHYPHILSHIEKQGSRAQRLLLAFYEKYYHE